MPSQTQTNFCRRIQQDSFVELRFLRVSKQTVDELVAHLVDIAKESHLDPKSFPTPIRLFINSKYARGAQPIPYLLKCLQMERPQLTMGKPIRIAATIHNNTVVGMLQVYFQQLAFQQLTFNAFTINQQQEAIQWLLETE